MRRAPGGRSAGLGLRGLVPRAVGLRGGRPRAEGRSSGRGKHRRALGPQNSICHRGLSAASREFPKQGPRRGREAPDTGSGLLRRSASGRLGAPRRFACRPSGRGRRAQLPENQRPAAARLSSGRAPQPPEPRPVFQKLGGSHFGSYKSPQARSCLAALLAGIYIPQTYSDLPCREGSNWSSPVVWRQRGARAIPEQNPQFQACASARAVSASPARILPPASWASRSRWKPVLLPKSLSWFSGLPTETFRLPFLVLSPYLI